MKKYLGIVMFLLLLSLSGCGIISLGYNYADVYLRYTINSYATFTDSQKEIIDTEVEHFMQWHRSNMLPQYVSLLQEMQRDVVAAKVLTKEDVANYRKEVHALYVKTLQPTVVPAAGLLSGIDAGQIREMAQSVAKESRKLRDKDLSGNHEEQLHKRAERSIDFLETLVGAFSDKQLEQIRTASHQLPFATAIYMQSKEDNQKHLIELMENGDHKEEIANFLSLWLLTPEKSRSLEEQHTLLAFEQASNEMIANIYAMLSERQKNTLLVSITKYIETFQGLSRKI